MKSKHRLDYDRLIHALVERGLADPEVLSHVLDQSAEEGALFAEILVSEGVVSDWELARVSSEVFGLAFLPTDVYRPSKQAAEGLDAELLREWALVPLDRFGNLITVAIPGVVPAEVLVTLAPETEVAIVPVVGTVAGNRRWLEKHLPAEGEEEPEEPEEPAEGARGGVAEEAGSDEGAAAGIELDVVEAALPESLDAGGDWAEVFDMGDQAVQLELQEREDDDLPGLE